MFLSPIPERSENGSKVTAFVGENVLGSWRVIFVEPPLDDPAVIQRPEAGGKRIWTDTRQRNQQVLKLAGSFHY